MAIRMNRFYGIVAAALLSCVLCIAVPAFADEQAPSGNEPVSTEPTDIATINWSLSKTSFTYSGKTQRPKVIAGNGITASDYSVSYSGNGKSAGAYSVKITGHGGFAGTKTLTYCIHRASVSKVKVKLSKKSYTYNGKKHKPSVRVTFGGHKLGKSDYSLKYSKGCKKAGTYKVVVKGKRNFAGTKTAKFRISKARISSAKLSHAKYYANGSSHRPGVTVKSHGKKLKKNRDFSVRYSGSGVSAGTYKVTVTGKGNYTGKKILKYKVVKKPAKKVAHHSASNGSAASGGTCWITASGNGVAYHSTPNCRSLSRSVPVKTSVSNARSMGMHACPNCH